MKHLGDICMLDGAKLPLVDTITFGSPCTDISIAGKRAGRRGAYAESGDWPYADTLVETDEALLTERSTLPR